MVFLAESSITGIDAATFYSRPDLISLTARTERWRITSDTSQWVSPDLMLANISAQNGPTYQTAASSGAFTKAGKANLVAPASIYHKPWRGLEGCPQMRRSLRSVVRMRGDGGVPVPEGAQALECNDRLR